MVAGKLFATALILMPFFVFSQGSIGSFTGDESVLYAQTKQVNQFFRRFNGEEDVNGKRFYEGDAGYRDLKMRKKYLGILFDNSGTVDQDVRDAFVLEVTSKSAPFYLDFHGKDWFAEVNAVFTFRKERVNIIMYLRLEADKLGYKWVISNIYFPAYEKYFPHVTDTINATYFLHPMSHELDFMNIHKAFDNPENVDYYLEKDYRPDMLTLFIEGIKEGYLKFLSVSNVKFHFFQVPRWYFEVSYFNRNSMNSGWLISNMVRINDDEKKDLIRNYSHEN
jgi:ribosomal protein L31